MKLKHLSLNTPVKRNVYVAGRRTSLQLERYVWDCVDAVCEQENLTLSVLCTELRLRAVHLRLAQALRLFVLIYFRNMTRTLDDVAGQADMLRSPSAARFNCLIETLQILSQHGPRA